MENISRNKYLQFQDHRDISRMETHKANTTMWATPLAHQSAGEKKETSKSY